MKKEQIIKKIKVLLGMVKEEFETAKLADGSEVSFDSLEINREVFDSEGNPLTAGEYVLEDGTKITVDENGVIKEIETKDTETKEEIVTEELACGEPKEKKEEMAEEPKVEEKTEETVETVEEPKVEYVTKEELDEVKTSIDMIYEMILNLTEKQTVTADELKKTNEAFSKFMTAPSQKSITHKTSKFEEQLDKIKSLKK